MQEIMGIFMQRLSTGDIRWVGTQYPCTAFAQEADMSLREYEDFVYAATYADREDPSKEMMIPCSKCWRPVRVPNI